MDIEIIPEVHEVTARRHQHQSLYGCENLKGVAFISFVVIIFFLVIFAAYSTITEISNKPPALYHHKLPTWGESDGNVSEIQGFD
jgi:hypothetical protein